VQQKQPSNSVAIYIVFILVGCLFGSFFWRHQGGVLGGILGYLLAAVTSLHRQLHFLKDSLATLPGTEPAESGGPYGEAAFEDMAQEGEDFLELEPVFEAPSGSGAVSAIESIEEENDPFTPPMTTDTVPPHPPESAPDWRNGLFDGADRLIVAVKNFFTTGNVILKIGLIVLFFGVSFLLKYAAQRNLVPIELRLTAVALGGLTLLGLGWRLRHWQLRYGLLLQGGGVGILYLTVFASAKLYRLLPFPLAFTLMVGLVALSGALAVLQNEKWLAIFGSVGGFLAPVLLSTGGGNHVALFSYYLLLNLGILGIAWFKAWRELNLLGFVFTFAIGSLWGSKYYQPAYFVSVEPFLLASFLLYVAVSILFALKQPIELKGYIDPPLVFGLPIATFALQYTLVTNFEYGLALSGIGFGLFYMFCAFALWRHYSAMNMLVEIFLSFGVVFGSLAIPLALDGYWITAAWAMEGAALIWVGVRQTRLRVRIFGVLLQLGAGISFLYSLHTAAGGLPVLNGLYLSSLILTAAGFFSSYYLTVTAEKIWPWEKHAVIPLLVWALAWWLGGGIREIDLFVRPAQKVNIFLLFLSFSCLAMGFAAQRLRWRHLVFPPFLLLPTLALLSLGHLGGGPDEAHLFASWGALCWAVAVAAQYILLHTLEKDWPEPWLSYSHTATLLLIILLLTQEGVWSISQVVEHGVWSFIGWGIIPAGCVGLVNGPGRKLAWPVGHFINAYRHAGIAMVVVYLAGWSLLAVQQPGNPAPLPYLPMLNPLEVFQLVVLLICWTWLWQCRTWLGTLFDCRPALFLNAPPAAIVFLWLNAAVARAVHFFALTPYDFVPLFHSVLFQASISILWSLTALALMILSTIQRSRQVWLLGAGVLALVVLKLFAVDLSGTGTLGRIVSFLVVGLLMLLIGYLSPLPPKQDVPA